MTPPASHSSLASDYDAFLFSPIGKEGNGMPLSVLSALARLDVDPWQEASQLAQLPGALATRRLLRRIEALPDPQSAIGDPGALAARLVALLPNKGSVQEPKRPVANSWILVYLLFAALVMGTEYRLASRPAPSGGSISAPPAHPDHR